MLKKVVGMECHIIANEVDRRLLGRGDVAVGKIGTSSVVVNSLETTLCCRQLCGRWRRMFLERSRDGRRGGGDSDAPVGKEGGVAALEPDVDKIRHGPWTNLFFGGALTFPSITNADHTVKHHHSIQTTPLPSAPLLP